MSQPQTIRLRESAGFAPRDVKVIDARYSVVRERSVWKRIRAALTTILLVALIGFAIPQVWLFAREIGVFFAAG